jgi:DNA-binding GntR family transcriptional regulator
MPRRDNLFKKTTNAILDDLRSVAQIDGPLASEAELGRTYNVSRTTIRAALAHLADIGVITETNDARILHRRPISSDYFGEEEVDSRSEHLESVFKQKVLRGDFRPGCKFSETELARAANVGTATVREFLIRCSRFGMVEKMPRGGWILHAFDPKFINELSDLRHLLETAAIRRFNDRSENDNVWAELEALDREHRKLYRSRGTDQLIFRQLDSAFHRLILCQLDNRFALELYDALTFAFHFHYQPSLADERKRTNQAIKEHLTILSSLRVRDVAGAEKHLSEHLATSRQLLLQNGRVPTNRARRDMALESTAGLWR